ncbi:hypothetical protein [Rhodopseudomonas sp. B29]|uniref:hypothetical protein n=1 Tax=Rhodopseudomonas sp. B29 TaxID=95607 RepID=UPI00034A61F6|nr:hypothetical protein [Rhodopseudomonas sp. B29]
MRGCNKGISAPRRMIADLMRASRSVPLITFKRTLDVTTLARARAGCATPPGFAAIFIKAFGLVAYEQPLLRTLYVGFPRPHLFELPCSIAMVAVARQVDGEDCVLMEKICTAEQRPLAEIDAMIRHASTAPIAEVTMFRKLLRISQMPWPLRRLAWWAGLSLDRPRANFFGSFAVSSVSAFSEGELFPVSPGPYVLSYGRLDEDGRIEVVIRFDHRLIDAAPIARAMRRLEQVLNGAVAAEIQAQPQRSARPVRLVSD